MEDFKSPEVCVVWGDTMRARIFFLWDEFFLLLLSPSSLLFKILVIVCEIFISVQSLARTHEVEAAHAYHSDKFSNFFFYAWWGGSVRRIIITRIFWKFNSFECVREWKKEHPTTAMMVEKKIDNFLFPTWESTSRFLLLFFWRPL